MRSNNHVPIGSVLVANTNTICSHCSVITEKCICILSELKRLNDTVDDMNKLIYNESLKEKKTEGEGRLVYLETRLKDKNSVIEMMQDNMRELNKINESNKKIIFDLTNELERYKKAQDHVIMQFLKEKVKNFYSDLALQAV